MAFTIVAPAYNEGDVIAGFVDDVVPVLGGDDELLIVDDGSTDSTPLVLGELQTRHPRLRVITHPSNRGLGAALVTGFEGARSEIVVTMDSDLSHPRDLIPVLVAACRSADAAFASRFVPGGSMDGVPWHRSVLSRAGNAVLRLLLRVPVRDMTTGFRAYRKDALADLHLRGTRFETQLEITVRLVDARVTIVEVALALGGRAAGESKMRYLRLIPAYGLMTLRLMALRWLRLGR
jgi:dolichol-phosphate mannosyltransferase